MNNAALFPIIVLLVTIALFLGNIADELKGIRAALERKNQ